MSPNSHVFLVGFFTVASVSLAGATAAQAMFATGNLANGLSQSVNASASLDTAGAMKVRRGVAGALEGDGRSVVLDGRVWEAFLLGVDLGELVREDYDFGARVTAITAGYMVPTDFAVIYFMAGDITDTGPIVIDGFLAIRAIMTHLSFTVRVALG